MHTMLCREVTQVCTMQCLRIQCIHQKPVLVLSGSCLFVYFFFNIKVLLHLNAHKVQKCVLNNCPIRLYQLRCRLNLEMLSKYIVILMLLASTKCQIADDKNDEISEYLLNGTQDQRIQQLSYKNLCQCQCQDRTIFVKERGRYKNG